MELKRVGGVAVLGVLAAGMVWAMSGEPKDAEGPEGGKPGTAASAEVSDGVIVYYFHGFARCQKCIRMEQYAEEALKAAFPKELAKGKLVWRPTNTDKPENAHFKKDYKLYTRTIVISAVRDGKETEWHNLEKIWNLVGNKQAYIEYVQKETRALLGKHG